jgi:formylglycine-generating enzyme required for sulfatase activity
MGSGGQETVNQGADAQRVSNESPVHKVAISAGFEMAAREVTRAEYATFVGATGRDTAGCGNWEQGGWVNYPERNWADPGFEQRHDHAVVCVSYDDAQAYVAWRSAHDGVQYRLPSEAEWEYAARAGASGQRNWADEKEACTYANGADLAAFRVQKLPDAPGIIFACDDGYAFTAPVGSFEANAFGLYDMLGSAWEWVEDCYVAGYDGAPADGMAHTDGPCEMRILRGGSWKYPARTVRFAIRGPMRPDVRTNNAGFRIVRVR